MNIFSCGLPDDRSGHCESTAHMNSNESQIAFQYEQLSKFDIATDDVNVKFCFTVTSK
ncbi:MAG: hypothetical protein RLZZ20_837 [Pseudomonadota bacterium]|jgi:hypothetical protein